jgi:hypothetical protein
MKFLKQEKSSRRSGAVQPVEGSRAHLDPLTFEQERMLSSFLHMAFRARFLAPLEKARGLRDDCKF